MAISASLESFGDGEALAHHFIVCGLGSMGQQCVVALKDFGVCVVGIESQPPSFWEVSNLPQYLDAAVVGDCRQNAVFERAGVRRCRAVLLVTSDEAVNLETALAVRRLNPQARLVVRSAQDTLNRLLQRELGNFIAFEPTQLPVTSFALAALSTETVGLFELDGVWLRVVRRQLSPEDPWCDRAPLHDLNTRHRRILAHDRHTPPAAELFHQWNPTARVRAGDTLVYVELTDRRSWRSPSTANAKRTTRWEGWQHLWERLRERTGDRARRVATVCGLTVLGLLALGTLLFRLYYPDTTWLSAFYATAILLLGGYADLFGNFTPMAVPAWLQGFGLLLTLAGTAFVGVLYALLTQALLSARFQFARQRPVIPTREHCVVVGLGRVGQGVAALLRSFEQSVLGVSFNAELDRGILPQIPILVGAPRDVLAKAHLDTAKSVLVLTDNEMTNMEMALVAREANPQVRLAIRTQHQRLSDDLGQLFDKAQIICAYAVAAEAFAGAAFGEKILGLLRLNNATVLVTEYQIEAGDTLNGLLLAEVAYGYGVVPLLYQEGAGGARQGLKWMPSDDVVLEVGDRLVVLASSEGLRRVEYGERLLPTVALEVERVLSPDSAFEGANAIARISGYSLQAARELFSHLPHRLPRLLYDRQGQRLLRELHKVGVEARLTNAPEQTAKK